jgi:WASH complex subunit strumpellin
MREIVDKHFADNWVLSFYMGYTIDLTVYWEQYKAAKNAMGNTLNIDNIKELIDKFQTKIVTCTKKSKDYLTEGQISEESILNNVNDHLKVIRDSNVTIRWLILHRNTAYKKAAELIKVAQEQILTLLLYTSQFEFLLKKMFSELVESKQQRWDDDKNSSCEKLQELADFFAQPTSLNNKLAGANNNYKVYFQEIKNQINNLNYNDATFAGRKMLEMIKALEDVEQFHQIASNLQIRSYLAEIRNHLKHMILTVNIRKQVLVNLAKISVINFFSFY